MSELVVLTGNIGCGKSTKAYQLAQSGYVIVNNDNIVSMVGGGDYSLYDENKKSIYHVTMISCIHEALATGFNIVIDKTNMTRESRYKWVFMGKIYNIPKITCYDWGPGTIEGLNRRKQHNRNYTGDWGEVWKKLKGRYERPEQDEGFNIIYRMEKGWNE